MKISEEDYGNKLYIVADEAERILRDAGGSAPAANGIRKQAQEDPKKLGFPVCVVGTRVYIPRWSFMQFWGLQ